MLGGPVNVRILRSHQLIFVLSGFTWSCYADSEATTFGGTYHTGKKVETLRTGVWCK
jgi:hypothetical protein